MGTSKKWQSVLVHKDLSLGPGRGYVEKMPKCVSPYPHSYKRVLFSVIFELLRTTGGFHRDFFVLDVVTSKKWQSVLVHKDLSLGPGRGYVEKMPKYVSPYPHS